jgi:hypothetical protein
VYEAELGALQDERAPRGDGDERRDAAKVVDYSQGGAWAPRLAPPSSNRQNPRHDHVTRVRMDHAAESGREDSDMMSWTDLQAARERFRTQSVYFPAPDMTPPPDPLGRSTRRSRGPYSRNEAPPLDFPAVEGMAVVRSPASGQRAIQAHVEGRFGPNVEPPVTIHSGMLDSSAPHLAAREAVQIVQERTASEHMRTQAGYDSMRRR